MTLDNSTAAATASELTIEGRQFLMALLGVAGNCVTKSRDLQYYRSDNYTWYNASDLLATYSKNQIGGFLSNLHSLGVVNGQGREAGFTEFGIEVAISVAQLLEAAGG